jgi:hypothetical protein
MGYISSDKLARIASTMQNSSYGDYLRLLVEDQEK